MAIGQRIKFFRNRKGFTQNKLDEMLGFHGKSSDVRMHSMNLKPASQNMNR